MVETTRWRALTALDDLGRRFLIRMSSIRMSALAGRQRREFIGTGLDGPQRSWSYSLGPDGPDAVPYPILGFSESTRFLDPTKHDGIFRESSTQCIERLSTSFHARKHDDAVALERHGVGVPARQPPLGDTAPQACIPYPGG